MARSSAGSVGMLLLCASLVFFTTTEPVSAQDDLLDKIVDDIVKGSAPTRDETVKDPPPVEKLDGGITRQVRKDKVEIFTRPDGTKQFVTEDGKKVTIRPNGERVFQAPGEPAKYLAPRVDDPDNFRPHRRPQTDTPPDPKTPAPRDPLPDFRMPEPQNPGGHAPYEELKNGNWLPQPLVKPAIEERPQYKPPPAGTDDKLVNSVLTPGRTGVFTYASGAVTTILPDGREVTTYPGIPVVNVRDASGKLTQVTPDPDGGIRVKGADAVTIDPSTGRAYVDYANGNREVIGPNGASAISTPNGGREARDANGNLIGATFKDPVTGASVRMDSQGVGIARDKDGNIIGLAVRDDKNGVKIVGSDGKELQIPELFDPKNRMKGPPTTAENLLNNGGYNQPAPSGNYTPPPPNNIFAMASAALRRKDLNGDSLLNLRTIDKVGKDIATADPTAKPEDNLDRTLKMVAATLKKSDLERDLKQIRDQMPKELDALKQEKSKNFEEKASLLLRQTKVENQRRELRQDALSRDLERNALTQQKILLDGQEASLLRREARAQETLAAALKRVDYSAYNLCPNKEPWKECGHGDLKKKWLNAQLAQFLGKGGIMELQKAKQDRDDYNQQKKDYEQKLKDSKQKDDDAKTKLSDLDGQAAALKVQSNQLRARETSLQAQVDQLKGRDQSLTKQIEGLSKYIDDLTATLKAK